MKGIAKLIAIAMALAIHQAAAAQTRIKLEREIEYSRIVSDTGEQSWKFYTDDLSFDWSYHPDDNPYDRPPRIDGTIEITGYSGEIFGGNYCYIPDVEGTIHPRGILAFFPAVEAIKSIKFFDKDGNVFIEDTFDYMPLYEFEIVKASDNTFSSVEQCNTYISKNGGRTWESIRNSNFSAGSFTISDEDAENADTVIVGFACNLDSDNWGVALWANNPGDYVFEFADVDIPGTQVSSNVPGQYNKSSRKPNKRGKKR